LVENSFIINYEYGQGRDLIYDYEEIEMYMRNLVSSLCLFDTDNLPMLNYQFELYNENNSLITNIRRRINQTSLSVVDQAQFKSLLVRMNHDEIVHCLGLLDHVFTYLCNIHDDVSGSSTQAFVEQHMNTNTCVNEHFFRRPPFSTVPLIHITALCELVEVVAFDIVLCQHVKTGLREAVLDDRGKTKSPWASNIPSTSIPPEGASNTGRLLLWGEGVNGIPVVQSGRIHLSGTAKTEASKRITDQTKSMNLPDWYVLNIEEDDYDVIASADNSALEKHAHDSFHKIDWDNWRIVDRDNIEYRLLIKESLFILAFKPNLNGTVRSVPLIVFPNGLSKTSKNDFDPGGDRANNE
ncbi:unnamed protein product, partial [Didymodactylos carnosus]